MVAALIFFILTVVDVAIGFTSTVPSNVHELMTRSERDQTFGTNAESVPEYHVVRMTLPGTRRRQQVDDEISLKVNINGSEINLNFKPTAGHLVTRYTPVWSAITDEEAYAKIRYDPLPNAMRDIGLFKMYHDVENEAAIVVYSDDDDVPIIEGIVAADYVIKSLPKRFADRFLKADEHTGSYVLFKPLTSSNDAESSAPTHNHREKRAERYRGRKRSIIPKFVYPEILIVVDHNAIRHKKLTDAMRFMIAFWNVVDMVYSTLDNPKVRLNIAGIIISADDAATPYIAEDTSIRLKENSSRILPQMGTYFYKELTRFPVEQYDMIMAMTTIRLCKGKRFGRCNAVLGYARPDSACAQDVNRMAYSKSMDSIAVSHYNRMFAGVQTVAHEIAHVLGVYHDTPDCSSTDDFVMAKKAVAAGHRFKWSRCSRDSFHYRFASDDSECLKNEPIWTKPFDKVLPGRWLSFNGQCQNLGFEKACEFHFRKVTARSIQSEHLRKRSSDLDSESYERYLIAPMCMMYGCVPEGSSQCFRHDFVALPGTKCGENMICEDYSCVSDE